MPTRSRRYSTSAAGLVLLLVLLACGGAAADEDSPSLPDEPGQQARQLLAAGEYQTEFPDGSVMTGRVFRGAGSLATLLMYIGIGVVLVLLVAWIVSEFDARREATGPAAQVAGTSGGLSAQEVLGEPERLASAGRYDEAIHIMLLLAIRYLGRDLPRPPRPSSTSRELLRVLPLEGERREAFRYLVQQVELSLFGGRAVDESDYLRCREQLEVVLPEATS